MAAGRVLLKPKPGVQAALAVGAFADDGLQVIGSLPQIGYTILSVPTGQEREWAQRLVGSPLVEVAQPDFLYSVFRDPNDYWYSQNAEDQWNLRAVNAPGAWDITTGSPDFVIAIVDTGVDDRHDDLVGKVLLKVDYVNEDNPYDGLGFHGTHVAGIAAANTDNRLQTPNIFFGGMAGMSWAAKLISVKVANHFGKAKDSDAAQGIIYTADQGAKIINLSFGGEDRSALLQDAVNYAYNKGILVVAAAGNCADDNYWQYDCTKINPPIYPAAGDNVLAVGAIDRQSRRASLSEHASYVAVVAPGEDILSTTPNQGFGRTKGTSQAAPHVSALANLIWSVNPSLSNAQVAGVITSTARDLGPLGKDDEYGYGLIDARAALAKATELAISTPMLAALAKSGTSVSENRSLNLSTGVLSLPWSAAVPGQSPWLSVYPTGGMTPARVTVSMAPSSLGAGVYQSYVTFSALGAEVSQKTVSATLVITDTVSRTFAPLAPTDWAAGW